MITSGRSEVTKLSILNKVRKTLASNELKNAIAWDDHKIDELIKNVEECWSPVKVQRADKKARGKLNWKLRFKPLPLTNNQKRGHGSGAEVVLERKIADAFDGMNCVWNQMPVASGLLERAGNIDKEKEEPRRAIDLVYRPERANGRYEFLELKVPRKSGSPDSLYSAAIEVFEYGLLYLFSRKNRDGLGYKAGDSYKVLDATHIALRVLAQPEYFKQLHADDNFPFDAVNRALDDYLKRHSGIFSDLTMDIGAESFLCNENDDPEKIRSTFIAKKPIECK